MECRFCELVANKGATVFYEDGCCIAALSRSQSTFCKSEVIYKEHAESPLDLDEESLFSFIKSVRKVSLLLKNRLNPELMNFAILRNYVSHLHCHVVPRFCDAKKDSFFLEGKIEPIEWGKWTHGRFRKSESELKEIAEMLKKGSPKGLPGISDMAYLNLFR